MLYIYNCTQPERRNLSGKWPMGSTRTHSLSVSVSQPIAQTAVPALWVSMLMHCELALLKCSSMGRITTKHAEGGKIIKGNMFYLTVLRAVRNKNIHLKVPLPFYCLRLKLRSSDLVPACYHGILQDRRPLRRLPRTAAIGLDTSGDRRGLEHGQTP